MGIIKMKSLLKHVKGILSYPFKKDLIYFFLLWVLISLPNCYSQKSNPSYFLYLAMMYYVITYLVVVVIDLHKGVAKILKPIILVIITLASLFNTFCVHQFGCLLSHDYVQIIAGTNPNEVKEFFSTYISWDVIYLFISIIAIIIFLAFKLPQLQLIKLGRTWMAAFILLLLSIGATCHNSGMVKEEFRKIRWNFRFDEVVDLRHHPTHPKIVETDSIHPNQIVIILGESFSSNHSSLYGYKKCTNPLLAKQEGEGNLLVFKNVKSPSTHTIDAFRYILNTYAIDSKDEKAWYDHTNLIETMKAVGYHTAWFSNQAEKGMFDNIPSSFAKLCDESLFMENIKNGDRYDGSLIGQKPSKHDGKFCVFYHLMGQHGAFEERYPKEYDVFKGKEYGNHPPHQRDVLASYDNATLYNDFVVHSIMESYKDQDAIVFYVPDHGLDIFDTNPDFFGHAKKAGASQEQGKKIPFIVYVSPIFKELHAKTVKRMKKTTYKSFCTDKLIYAVMDVAGFRFEDNDDVNLFSMFL